MITAPMPLLSVVRLLVARLPVALLLAGLLSTSVGAANAAAIESFWPQGETKTVRQVVARFSQPMVPFGDLRELNPFDVSCSVPGRGRWADPKNWVYDFDKDLPGGVKCQFSLNPELKSLDGEPVAWGSGVNGNFNTGGPAVIDIFPGDGNRSIDANQIFMVTTNAPVTEETVTKHAWCQISGINEKVGVKIVDGSQRQALLAQSPEAL